MWYRIVRTLKCIAAIAVLCSVNVQAQFSPGELSQVHSNLEGISNCVQCHEVGAEISGAKCLACHTEIKKAIRAGHGFHAGTASQRCIDCHKEHLGRNAETVIVSRNKFDHNKTGFTLTGKHRALKCEDCHRPELVKDTEIQQLMVKRGRASVLGLVGQCSACHRDRHRQTLGTECQTCHSTEGWTPVATFDHGKTAFRLQGKHATVECIKCHTQTPGNERLFEVPPTQFADCTPCHTSPHRQKLAERCSTCHNPTAWTAVTSTAFNHDATGFPLRGRHASTECAKCHGEGAKPKGASAGNMRVCSDCHTDYHRGEFAAKYGNDCSVCHSVYQFSPATFTIEMHEKSRLPLTGAHRATVCNDCHRRDGKNHTFHFAAITCNVCHKDPHAGQFAQGGVADCATCHQTSTWKLPNLDHAKTGFALVGKHATASCEKCHKAVSLGGVKTIQYIDTPSDCVSCHNDPHLGQFLTGLNTTCSACHSPAGWFTLVFDHTRQSAFSLTGAHATLPCRSCHPVEEIGSRTMVRFKPLDKECQHCHSGRIPDGR